MARSERHCRYLHAMGVPVWLARNPPPPPDQAADASPRIPPDMAPAATVSADWQALKQQVHICKQCSLSASRTQTVFGVGDRHADLLLIGEAPGAEEDRRGEPFVGRAGKLLDAMLLAIGLRREQVFIANILKCRPPGNRDPLPQEVRSCEPYLRQQIAMLQPRLIVALGRIAAQNLLKTETPIGRMRGQQYRYGETNIPVVVTYHPAYLLRSPREKRKSWQDLQLVMRLLEMT